MFLVWLVFGAIIGGIAARTRGFSSGGGVIGGAVLGLFAVFLFLVPPPRSCPFCKERIRVDAVVCKHCHRDLYGAAQETHQSETPPPRTPMTTEQKRIAWGLAAGLVIVFASAGVANWLTGAKTPTADQRASDGAPLRVTARSLAIAAQTLQPQAFASEFDNRPLYVTGTIAGIVTRDNGGMEIELKGDGGTRVYTTFVPLTAPPRRSVLTNQQITVQCEKAFLSPRGLEISFCGRPLLQ